MTQSPVADPAPVRVTLMCARAAVAQQAALAAWLDSAPPMPRAVIAEGALFGIDAPADVMMVRLAPGCVCCLGLVPLRVNLTRLLRNSRPRALLLLVASDEHLPRLRALLASGDLGPLDVAEPKPADTAAREATPTPLPTSEPAMQRIHANGIDIAFLRRPHPDPARPWLVFAHSLACDHTMWQPQLDTFGVDYSLLAYDMRGHGSSSAPAGDYPLTTLADDLLALLDAQDIKQCHFIGLSLGGMVGQQVALRQPDRFASLTLADTTSRQGPGAREIWEERIASVRGPQGMQAIVDATLQRWFTPAFRASTPAQVARIGAIIGNTPLNGYVGCAHAVVNIDLTDQLHRITCPVLVIVGREDVATTPAMAQTMAGAIGGAQLVVIDAAAHLSNLEQPAQFDAALRAFLRAC